VLGSQLVTTRNRRSAGTLRGLAAGLRRQPQGAQLRMAAAQRAKKSNVPALETGPSYTGQATGLG
jgi:hypothetical protein